MALGVWQMRGDDLNTKTLVYSSSLVIIIPRCNSESSEWEGGSHTPKKKERDGLRDCRWCGPSLCAPTNGPTKRNTITDGRKKKKKTRRKIEIDERNKRGSCAKRRAQGSKFKFTCNDNVRHHTTTLCVCGMGRAKTEGLFGAFHPLKNRFIHFFFLAF